MAAVRLGPVEASLDEDVVERIMLHDYEAARSFVDKLDGQLLAIRNLAVLSASAVVATAASQNNLKLLLANAAVIPAFMLMELVYKSFHEDGIARVSYLEQRIVSCVRHKSYPRGYRFGIGVAIQPLSFRRMIKIALDRDRWHIHLLYVLLMLLTAFAYVFIHWATTLDASFQPF